MIHPSKPSVRSRYRLVFRLLAILFAILIFEFLLRLFGFYRTYTESIGHGYKTYFNQQISNRYSTHPNNDSFTLDHIDFRFTYHTNEIGLREISLDTFLAKNEKGTRILTLGDSFTEGVGADRHNSYPRFLERLLQQSNSSIAVFNAGRGGSDPFFDYIFYKEKLAVLNPELVIAAVNSSDEADYFFRGGMERFQSDGTVKNRKGPWYEKAYASSYVLRFFVETILGKERQLLVTEKESNLQASSFYKEAAIVMKELKSLLPEKSRLLVVVFPSPVEAVNKDYYKNTGMKKRMHEFLLDLKSKDIDTLNLFPHFEGLINEENYFQYSFKNDGHFTPEGYRRFAEFIASTIDSLLRLSAGEVNAEQDEAQPEKVNP